MESSIRQLIFERFETLYRQVTALPGARMKGRTMNRRIHQRLTRAVLALAAAALLPVAPAGAAGFLSFTVDNALSSSLAGKARVDYVVAPDSTIVLRAVVQHLPGEPPVTVQFISSTPDLIPNRDIPRPGPAETSPTRHA